MVTPTSGACIGTPFNLVVTINPVAKVQDMTTITCSGVAFSVTPVNGTNGIIPAGTTYSWLAPNVSGGITGGQSGAAATNIFGTLTNPTNIAQTASYQVTPTTVLCGAGLPFTVTVSLNPVASVVALTATTCSGTSFTLTPVNGTNGIVPAGTTYTWSAPTGVGFIGGQSQISAVNSIYGTLVNTTNTAHTATYFITPLSGNCTGSVFTAGTGSIEAN